MQIPRKQKTGKEEIIKETMDTSHYPFMKDIM